MSGHNPHGRLGQPNSSYNHLQVPYIPRHPQLAHMNDSILRSSSPLNWQHADAAFFNYMTTQHKTQLELNALPFVRPPADSSFGTVDLSFPSHYRHNLTPSPHNTNSTLAPNSVTPSSEFNTPLQFSPKSSLNCSTAVQSPNNGKEVKGGFVNGDKISDNGSEKLTNCDSVMAPNLSTGLFVAHQSSMTHSEPIELIKEKILKNFHDHIEHNSTQNATPLPSHSPPPSIFASLSNSTMNNNTNIQRLSELPSPNHTNITNSHNTSRESQAATSNDDSADSNAPKKRRRRKPNKTCRLSNNDNDIDDDVVSNNNRHLEPVASNEFHSPNNMNTISEAVEANSTSCENKNSGKVNQIVEPRLSVHSQNESNAENSVGRSDVSGEFSSSPTKVATQTIKSPNELNKDNNSSGNISPNQWQSGKRSEAEGDADCETIDKIAALIASSSPDFDPQKGRSTPIQENRSSPILENGNSKTSMNEDNADQKDRRFEDVEIKLEEMFAGIDDDIDQTKVKNTKLDGCKELSVTLETIATKSESRKKIKAKTRKKKLNSSSSDEADHKAKKTVKRLPKSKTNKVKGKKNTKPAKGSANVTDNQKTKIKDETLDAVTKFRGPFIHVTTDGTSNVVNAPITEEIAESKSKVKKAFISHNQNDRSKIRGLHVSTLSTKYDASTTDKTWMCVFCKMGPHKFGLGDLFGPYILSTTCEDFELSQVSPTEDVFKSKKTKANMIQRRTLPSVAVAVTTGNKRKRKGAELTPSTSFNTSIASNDVFDLYYGMTKTTDTSYEVWVHGDCAVWSSGVHLIGTRIVGLEAAVWSSLRHQCIKCQNYGAMLSCFKRGCGGVAHIPCARKANWNLCDEDFKVLCDKHRENVEKLMSTKQT